MKVTEQLSIGGYAFTVEKDAAAALQEYIGALEQHYLSQEGGKEIMDGIEERVAELLLDRAGHGGVVTLDHVKAVINIVGRPERIEADDPGPEASAQEKQPRKLFRDVENKRLGGVCAGLATFLQTDVAWIRLAFVILTLVGLFTVTTSGVITLGMPLLYCILWVAMPAARTAQDRWAMNGEGGTADEIRRNVQAGLHEMGNAAREVGRSDFFQKFGKAILLVVGVVLLVAGASGLASISIISLNNLPVLGLSWQGWMDHITHWAPWMSDWMSQPWVPALLSLAVLLPLIGILYAGVMMVFGFKSPSWRPGLVIFVLWLIVLVVLSVTLFTGVVTTDYFHIEHTLFNL